jgi:hypothetical protein
MTCFLVWLYISVAELENMKPSERDEEPRVHSDAYR